MEIKGLDNSILSIISRVLATLPEKRRSPTVSGHPGDDITADVRQEAIPSVKIPEVGSTHAFFALDDKDNVVIKVVDGEGNLIMQIPPEEYIKMVKAMKDNIEHLFSKEV